MSGCSTGVAVILVPASAKSMKDHHKVHDRRQEPDFQTWVCFSLGAVKILEVHCSELISLVLLLSLHPMFK